MVPNAKKISAGRPNKVDFKTLDVLNHTDLKLQTFLVNNGNISKVYFSISVFREFKG